MSKASEIYNTLINDVSVLGPISYLELRKGDLVARIDKGITTIFTYESRFGDRADVKGGGQLFLAGTDIKLYLIDRPKPPLPTLEGAEIVAWKIGDKEFNHGVRLVHDGTEEWDSPWYADDDNCYYQADRITEWAVIPDDFYNTLRKDAVK